MTAYTCPTSVLGAERERLLAEQERLLQYLPGMEPAMAARAASVLAEKLAALATEYENLEDNHGQNK